MSSPELIDPRFDELVAELRSARPAAPADVRSRVAGLAVEEPAPQPARPRFSWRRGGLVLVPVAAVAVAAAVVVGVVDSGGGNGPRPEVAAERAAVPRPPSAKTPPVLNRLHGPATQGAVPSTSAGRTQLYAADLTVRVKDVSAATKRALDLTRSFGGYVRAVDYGKGTAYGGANLVVRVPIGSVQAAIVRFSALGRILDQHVSIQDIQPSIDARFRRLQSLRVQIAKVQEQLAAPGLSDEQQAALEAKLTRARAELTAVQHVQGQARKRASFATISLGLRTKAVQVAPPAQPSRFDRTLDRIGDVLLVELEVALYVLAIAVPLAVLAALAIWALRGGRRRSEDRLLAR
jgi:hypothetical protein